MSVKLGTDLERIAQVTGPYAPVVDKIADRHIRTIRISLRKDKTLRSKKEAIRKAVRDFEAKHRYDGHITLNVDPS